MKTLIQLLAEVKNNNTIRRRNVKESYNDVGVEGVKSNKKLSQYKNYKDKKVIGNYTYLNFEVKSSAADKWYLEGQIYVFDNEDETEVANSFYGKQYGWQVLKATIDVRPDKRRLGIASNIYEWIEKLTGETLHPDEPHSKSAAALWANPKRKFGPNR